MNKFSIVVCGLLLYCSSPLWAEPEKTVQIAPAVTMTASDEAKLLEINKLLKERQAMVAKIMAKDGLTPHLPLLPNYSAMSENSVQSLLNQLDFTDLAKKLGAAVPARPDLETGVALKNNRFLHFYNNCLLRSIAKKLGVATPAAVDFKQGSLEEQCFALAKQNNDLVHAIGVKRGAL